MLAVTVGLFLAATHDTGGGASGRPTDHPSLFETETFGGTDLGVAALDSLSNRQLEELVDDSPSGVPLRLALTARYLSEGDVEAAHAQAATALEQAAESGSRQRALRFAGWTTALMGEPAAGADLLEQSLDLDPSDDDARWFLANVALYGLGDPAAAIGLLDDLPAEPADPDQQATITAVLEEARGLVAGGEGDGP